MVRSSQETPFESATVEALPPSMPMPAWRRMVTAPWPFGMTPRNLLAVSLFLALLAWFAQPLSALFVLTQHEEHYSHIVLIPAVTLWSLFLDRAVLLSSREWSPWLGAACLGVGAFLYSTTQVVSGSSDHLSIVMAAFVILCWGIVLLCFGLPAFCKNQFALLFLLFMVPLPTAGLSAIIGFLQRSSAEVTAVLFSWIGIPVFRDGFVFSLSNFTIHVAEECSGIRSTLSLVITSVMAGHFFLRTTWAKLALVLLVLPLAIVKNACRIVGLTLLANYVDPTYITDSILHRGGGIPLFIVALMVLAGLVWGLRRLEVGLGAKAT